MNDYKSIFEYENECVVAFRGTFSMRDTYNDLMSSIVPISVSNLSMINYNI